MKPQPTKHAGKAANPFIMRDKNGVKYRYLKVGDFISDEDQYRDAADKKWKPTTNSGHRVNHPRMYRHPLRFQHPVGCLTARDILSA